MAVKLEDQEEAKGIQLLSRAQKQVHKAVANLEDTINSLQDAGDIRGFAGDARPTERKLEAARRKIVEAMQAIGFW